MKTPDHLLTVAQAARLARVSPATIWRAIAAGRLAALRVGPKLVRVRPEDLKLYRENKKSRSR